MAFRPGIVVLDFDGTFTDVEREAAPYVAAYRADLERRFGETLAARWDAVWEEVASRPECGWKLDGKVVAPAVSDPYIRSTVTADTILAREGLEPDPEARRSLLAELYRTHYREAGVVFRPDARPTLEALLRGPWRLVVVSNSETGAVRAKIARLGAEGSERLEIVGGARKYVVVEPEPMDERFAALPEQVRVEGLGRPLLPRRGHYYEVLRRLWEETATDPRGTFVCGDIFELDLLLPGMLEARVHLLARSTTPRFERQALEKLPAGSVGTELSEVLELLDAP